MILKGQSSPNTKAIFCSKFCNFVTLRGGGGGEGGTLSQKI